MPEANPVNSYVKRIGKTVMEVADNKRDRRRTYFQFSRRFLALA